MMRRLMGLTGFMWVCASLAQEPVIAVPELLPEPLAQRWLAQDPSVQSAEHALEATRAEAGLIKASPYEWTARYQHQQRDYGTGPKSNEWNAGLERTLRLPGKIGADRDNAQATLRGAEAQYSWARRQATEALIGRWLDWLEARSTKTLWEQQQQFAEESLGVVVKRVQSGDAATLEQRLADAELADVQRNASAAATTEAKVRTTFMARYAAEEMTPAELPEPLSVPHDAGWWQERILTASDQLTLAKAEAVKAQAAAEHAKQDRIPDPTVGIFAGREAYGNENIVGVSISMPLPGERRSLQLRQQLAQADLAKDNLEIVRRELMGQARSAFAEAQGDYKRWQLAKSAADAMADNARLVQKAYRLGEQDLQTLLMARRQALSALQAEQSARVDAFKMYYKLLLDAKLLWVNSLTEAANDVTN